MKETQVLLKQHIGRLIRIKWFTQGKVKIVKTSAEESLRNRGHEVTEIKEFLFPPRPREKIKVVGLYDREPPIDENHPDYKCEPCLIFRDDNVPILGLDQAKVLTNTVEICEGLPEVIAENERKLNLSDAVHSEVVRKLKLSCMLEATQEKLPKRKDPSRPAWVFPREYGISACRKNELLCKNLAMICEQFSRNKRKKSIILDALFSTPLKAHQKLIQFELTSELVVTTGKRLGKLAEPSSTHSLPLPELYPVCCTVGLNPHHFYMLEDIYPFFLLLLAKLDVFRDVLQNMVIGETHRYSPAFGLTVSDQSEWPYIQLAFVHYNSPQVKNLSGEPVTESQTQARSLLKGFTMAAAEARALFGCDVKELPEPIVVPVVQTDGKMFHFTIFQLNTLDLDNSSQGKNIFWNSNQIPLYENCEYQAGRPVLKEYNQEVIRKLITFYNIE